jgi:hypothetical protein
LYSTPHSLASEMKTFFLPTGCWRIFMDVDDVV